MKLKCYSSRQLVFYVQTSQVHTSTSELATRVVSSDIIIITKRCSNWLITLIVVYIPIYVCSVIAQINIYIFLFLTPWLCCIA